MRHKLLIYLLFILNVSFGQKNFVSYLSVEEGLSQNEVTDVIQDSKGFMWFATRGGLNRFDGYNLIHFKSRGNNAQGLSNPSIECIYEDANSKIWIGSILSKLNELNLIENTIVIFLSDNGGPERTNGSDNGVLRGGKSQLFEGGVRVPFAMQWPAKIPAGMVYEKPVISLDIFSSVIAQTSSEVKPKNQLDGVNLIPHLNGENNESPHDYLYWRKFDAKKYAVLNGEEKLIIENENEEMLFDLKNDIGEQSNQSNTKKERVVQLNKDFRKWESEMQGPVFTGLLEDKIYHQQHPERFKKQTK